MKKLIIIAAVVCAAIASQAASYNWKTAAANQVYVAGSTTDKYASGTAYLFDSTSQSTIFAMLVAGSDVSGLAIDTSAISAGAIASKTGADLITAGDTLSAYFAIVDGDNFYISTTASIAGPETGFATLSFKEKTASQAAFKDASAGFAGAGWYQSVPEPTSGLLLLLGMAGLALKRKQA